jgi:hypothetical protein
MTALLPVIVALVGLVALIDLTLTYALIRRVNEIQSHGSGGGSGNTHPEPGYRIGDFTAQTIDGLQVSEPDLQGRTILAAFIMTGCSACHRLTDELSQMLSLNIPLVLFVASTPGDDEEATRLTTITPLATSVCIIEPHGAVTEAFDISGFPTVIRIEDGVARATGMSIGSVRGGRKAAGVR